MFWVELYLILQISLWFVTHLGLNFPLGERNALIVLLGLGIKCFLLFIDFIAANIMDADDRDKIIPIKNESIHSGFTITNLFPNPFNPVVQINFKIVLSGVIEVNILDMTGSHIETIHSRFLQYGSHKLSWNAESMPSGIYFISLKSGEKNLTEKVVLLK